MATVTEKIVYVGDVGTKLRVNVTTSLTSATAYHILIKKANGAIERFPVAGDCTKESDTQLSYSFIAGDLDVAGTWRVQPVVTYSNGVWRGATDDFKVIEHFK